MGQIRRRTVLAATGAVVLGRQLGMPLIRNARAAEFRYKLGTNLPGSHPLNVRLQQAADQVKADTGGKLEIALFPNSQLGGDPEMFSQVRSGALEFFPLSGANVLSNMVVKGAISGVGFAFKDSEQVYGAMDGELGAYIRGLIRQTGLEVLDKVWDNGFRQITTGDKPIEGPQDLRNMKIRVPPGKLWISLFQSLGAAPTPISFNEVYSALQTKIVEGQENPLAVVDVAKLYEVQKYCSLTNHMWDGYWFLINGRAWKRLTPDLQETVAKRFNAAALDQRQDVIKLNDTLRGSLEAQGLKFNTVDPQPFRQTLKQAGFYTDWKKTFGDEEWGLLEKVTGPLT
jgi:tripartite ATP-independent transporter DctP family solute receptor